MYRKNHRGLASRRLPILGALALACTSLFAIVVRPASAADVNKEMSTAAQHAGFAASSKDMKTTQMHLHHFVNCLVGPQGEGYDASFGNPCDGQGSGAISDTTIVPRRRPCSKPFSRPTMASSNPTWLLLKRTRPPSRFF